MNIGIDPFRKHSYDKHYFTEGIQVLEGLSLERIKPVNYKPKRVGLSALGTEIYSHPGMSAIDVRFISYPLEENDLRPKLKFGGGNELVAFVSKTAEKVRSGRGGNNA